jgi:hypothetical protein
MVTQVGYSVARRSRGRVTPFAICTVHMETSSAGFLDHSDGFHRFGLKTGGDSLASKPVVTVSDGLASKPAETVSSGLTSKSTATVSPDLASKLVVGFLVEPPNQGGGRFLGLGLKTGSYGLVIWASKSP